MGDTTGINWCDSTFNPWQGCTKISPACDHCYAERDTKRFGLVEWGAGKMRVRTGDANWRKPVQWNSRSDAFRECGSCGWRGDLGKRKEPLSLGCPVCGTTDWEPARRRVFCASLGDWLDNEVPIEWLVDLLDLIRLTPDLNWLLLSKRIGNLMPRLRAAGEHSRSMSVGLDDPLSVWINAWHNEHPPENVWLGATVIDQGEADRDIPKLLNVPAHVRFLSIEPMLGPIDLSRVQHLKALSWVICGGESGSGARPMSARWVRSLAGQCLLANIPFLFKQWGEWAPFQREMAMVGSPATTRAGYAPATKMVDGVTMQRIGKKAAGRILDSVLYDGFPRKQGGTNE